MKLEELLGEELFAQVKAKIDEVNEGKEDKLEMVRFADLSEGNYVSKNKYEELMKTNGTTEEQLAQAQKLINDLKEGAAKEDTEAQGKIADFEKTVAELQQELMQTKINSAIQVGLLKEDAVDTDYLAYKLREQDGELELDENGQIKGWNDKITALKTQCPAMFSGKNAGYFEGFKAVDKNQQQNVGMTKEELLRKSYREQVAFAEANPEAYQELMNK